MNDVTVILWRHAPTPHNAQGRLQGRLDTPAGEAGLKLGRQAAQQLLATYGPPTRVYSSPLQRAALTAQLLVAQTGNTDLALEIDQGINQRSYGVWEGKTLDEVRREHPEELEIRNAGGDPDIEGWEAGATVGERVAKAITDRCAQICADPDVTNDPLARPVLVFTSHGSAITMGVRKLLDLDPSQQIFGHLSHANWVELRLRADTWTVARFNCGPHLP